MFIRKIYVGFTNGVNFFFKGTFHRVDTAEDEVEIYEGAKIVSITTGGVITTEDAHGLKVKDVVRLVDQLDAVIGGSPFDIETEYNVTAVSSATVFTINASPSTAGTASGMVGKKTRDFIRLANVDIVAIGGEPVEDRVG